MVVLKSPYRHLETFLLYFGTSLLASWNVAIVVLKRLSSTSRQATILSSWNVPIGVLKRPYWRLKTALTTSRCVTIVVLKRRSSTSRQATIPRRQSPESVADVWRCEIVSERRAFVRKQFWFLVEKMEFCGFMKTDDKWVPVWPDFATLRHFGKIGHPFECIFRVWKETLSYFGTLLRFWVNFHCFT